MATAAPERRNASRPPAGTMLAERLLAGLPVTERRLQLAGISTAVLEGGDGPPVVLLHGPGAYAAHWMRVIPGLVATHRVIAPDLPGHGASEVAGGPLDADRVLAWLGELIERTCPTPPGAGRAICSAAPSRPASPSTTATGSAGSCSWTRSACAVPAGAGVRARLERIPRATDRRTRTTVSGSTAPSISTACASGWASAGSRSKAYNLDRARTPSVQAALHAHGAVRRCRRSRRRTWRGSPFPRP